MAKMDNKDLVTGGFLSFSLMGQEIIAIMFALYSYFQGEMALATLYLAIAGVLLFALGIFYIFNRHNLARLLLASTLVIGFFGLLLGASGTSSLMWCLTTVPVIVGAFGYRDSLFMLIGIFAAATWIMVGTSMPFNPPNYNDVVVVRFLSAYVILAVFALAMDSSRFKNLSKYNDLSSRVDQITHQDQLTQLPNRNSMESRLEHKYQQYRRIHQPFSILLADLDNFKFINDRYGHDAGDRVLLAMGQVLSDALRREDTVARWGDNEFMVLLPCASNKTATHIAERLRLAAGELDMDARGDKLMISLSIGIASIDKCIDIDDLLSTAENGLYQAKQMGRDMVVAG